MSTNRVLTTESLSFYFNLYIRCAARSSSLAELECSIRGICQCSNNATNLQNIRFINDKVHGCNKMLPKIKWVKMIF